MQLTDRFWHLLWYKLVKVVADCAAAGTAIFGVGIICFQALGWLQTAHWVPYTIGEALHDLGVPDLYTSYLGVQKIIDTIMLWPASVGYLAVAFLCGWISVKAAEAETKIEWQDRLKRNVAEKREPQSMADVARELEEILGQHSRERD